MSVVRDLGRIHRILLDISERPDCAEITGYDGIAVGIFMRALDRAIKRYKGEALRVKKYYRR